MSDFYKDSYKIRKYELFSLSVCNVGHQKCDPNHHWGPGVKDHYLIHHIVTGKGYYHCNGKLYTLKAGDSFLIYPTMLTRKIHGNIPGLDLPETMHLPY